MCKMFKRILFLKGPTQYSEKKIDIGEKVKKKSCLLSNKDEVLNRKSSFENFLGSL